MLIPAVCAAAAASHHPNITATPHAAHNIQINIWKKYLEVISEQTISGTPQRMLNLLVKSSIGQRAPRRLVLVLLARKQQEEDSSKYIFRTRSLGVQGGARGVQATPSHSSY